MGHQACREKETARQAVSFAMEVVHFWLRGPIIITASGINSVISQPYSAYA